MIKPRLVTTKLVKKMKYYSLAFLLIVFAGCGGDNGERKLVSGLKDTNARRLLAVYQMYVYQNQFKAPKNEEALRDFMNSGPGIKRKLKRAGIESDNLEEIFISERDGKPLKVRYGLNGVGDYPIVFEAEGVNGKRLVAFNDPREVDAAEYDALWEGEVEEQLTAGTPDLTP